MSPYFSAFFFILAVGVTAGLILTSADDRNQPYRCSFTKMQKTYLVTKSQIEGTSEMITARSGDRVFMFKRKDLKICEKHGQ